jgi:hypothetical protein
MTFPPSFVRLARGQHRFWLPVFLLWPLLLLVWLVGGLCAAVALLVFSPRALLLVIDLWGGLARMFFELRGTHVAVQANGANFDLTVY